MLQVLTQKGKKRKGKSLSSHKNSSALPTAPTSSTSPSNYSQGPIILELLEGTSGVCLGLAQKRVSLPPKQELDRRQSQAPVGLEVPTAVRHFITGQCPLTRDPGRISSTAEEVCAFLGPYGSARSCRGPAAAWHGPGARTPFGPAAPAGSLSGCFPGGGGATPSSRPPRPAQLGLGEGQKVSSPALQGCREQSPSRAAFPLGDPGKAPLCDPPARPEWARLTTALHAGAQSAPRFSGAPSKLAGPSS